MGTLVYEEWGEHEALLLVPEQRGPEVSPPEPRTARVFPEGMALELGGHLPHVDLRYETYGRYARRAVLVFHALSGSAHVAGTYDDATLERLSPLERAFGRRGWWNPVVAPGGAIDTERRFVVAANVLGSCYGSTGPVSPAPDGRPYGPRFPGITIRDMVRAQAALLDLLGIEEVDVIGGSMGGMQALEFALMFPERVRSLVVIAAPGRHGPWAQALSELGRRAVLSDPGFAGGHYRSQPQGLALARAIAMAGYRHPESFERRFGTAPEQGPAYLDYHGRRFLERFDANTYLTLLDAMDRHDIGRGRGGLAAALDRLRGIPALFVGIDSDLLYPAAEVKRLAELAGAEYAEIQSPHGHDAFLIEHRQLSALLAAFGWPG